MKQEKYQAEKVLGRKSIKQEKYQAGKVPAD